MKKSADSIEPSTDLYCLIVRKCVAVYCSADGSEPYADVRVTRLSTKVVGNIVHILPE